MAAPAPLTPQSAPCVGDSSSSLLQPQGDGGGPPPKQIGVFMEVFLFSLFTLIKAFQPIAIDASKTITSDGRKAILYNPNSVIVTKDCLIVALSLLVCRVVGGSRQVASVFEPKPLAIFAMSGFLYTCADILEMASMGSLSGAAYQIMMQSSIIITALLTMCLKSIYQTRLQWIILFDLMGSMSIYMMQTSGSGSGGSGGFPVLGMICALLKVVALCTAAVIADKYAKVYKDDPTHVQIARVYVTRPFLLIAASAAAGKIDANYFANWTAATYTLIGSYMIKAISGCYVTMVLDSMLKTIAESVAVLVIFSYDVVRDPSSFDVAIFASVMMVVLACASYVESKQVVEKARNFEEIAVDAVESAPTKHKA